MRDWKSVFREESGSTFVFILIVLLVIMILSTSILFVFNNNLKQTKHIQDRQEAYYLAYSGIEIGLAALLVNSNENLNKLIRETNPISDLTESNIVVDNGKITIIAKKSDEENFDGWIELTSIAVLDRNGFTYTRTMYFDPDNPIDAVYVNN